MVYNILDTLYVDITFDGCDLVFVCAVPEDG
jgi:hypothetical protein